MSAIWVQTDETDEGTLWMIGCSNCGFEDEAYSTEEAHFTIFEHEDECDAAAGREAE